MGRSFQAVSPKLVVLDDVSGLAVRNWVRFARRLVAKLVANVDVRGRSLRIPQVHSGA
jgi:hypothetical protein